MYLMFKIKIFKMQLLKNYTANPVNSTCSLSICSPSFSENCPTRGVFSKKNPREKKFDADRTPWYIELPLNQILDL